MYLYLDRGYTFTYANVTMPCVGLFGAISVSLMELTLKMREIPVHISNDMGGGDDDRARRSIVKEIGFATDNNLIYEATPSLGIGIDINNIYHIVIIILYIYQVYCIWVMTRTALMTKNLI